MDDTLLRLFNQDYTLPLLDLLMIAVTTVGFALLPTLGVGLFISRERRVGKAILVTLGVGLLLTLTFWALTMRPRPDFLGIRPLLPIPPFPSYPSAHAVAAFGTAMVLILSYRRLRWQAIVLVGASLIAFSRLYLTALYPSDVLGGIILGSAIGAASYGFFVIGKPADKPAWRWLLWPQLGLVFLATQMAYLGILPYHLLEWPLADKVLHFLLFGAIVFWLRLWLGERMVQWNSYSIPLVLLLAFTFAIVDESLQYLSPLRTVNIADLLSNFAGMLFFWWLAGRELNKYSEGSKEMS